MTLASIWITGSRGGPIFGVTVLITVLGCHIAIAGGIKGEHRMARSAAESPSLLAYRTVPTQLRAAALHEAVGSAHVYIYQWSHVCVVQRHLRPRFGARFAGRASGERRKCSVVSSLSSSLTIYTPVIHSVAALKLAGAAGAIGAVSLLQFTLQ